MEIINKLFNKKKKHTLEDDIGAYQVWLSLAMNSSGYRIMPYAEATLSSLSEIDRFLKEQSGDDGIIRKNGIDKILFALGCYVGEAIINDMHGRWITNDSDPCGRMNISVRLDDGSEIFPVKEIYNVFENEPEKGIRSRLAELLIEY